MPKQTLLRRPVKKLTLKLWAEESLPTSLSKNSKTVKRSLKKLKKTRRQATVKLPAGKTSIKLIKKLKQLIRTLSLVLLPKKRIFLLIGQTRPKLLQLLLKPMPKLLLNVSKSLTLTQPSKSPRLSAMLARLSLTVRLKLSTREKKQSKKVRMAALVAWMIPDWPTSLTPKHAMLRLRMSD